MSSFDDLFTEGYETEEIQHNENANDDGGEEAEEAPTRETVKPKRIVRNPQPKLNEQTLKGPRGLTALPSYFERVGYKGRAHEEGDLNVILKTYEYWCHRLFPKFAFNDCVERIERLGAKRAIVTHVKRIRNDLVDEAQPRPDDAPEDGPGRLFDSSSEEEAEAPVVDHETVRVSEEMQEIIRQNRERARKIREEKLVKMKEALEKKVCESGGLEGQLEDASREAEDVAMVDLDSLNNMIDDESNSCAD